MTEKMSLKLPATARHSARSDTENVLRIVARHARENAALWRKMRNLR